MTSGFGALAAIPFSAGNESLEASQISLAVDQRVGLAMLMRGNGRNLLRLTSGEGMRGEIDIDPEFGIAQFLHAVDIGLELLSVIHRVEALASDRNGAVDFVSVPDVVKVGAGTPGVSRRFQYGYGRFAERNFVAVLQNEIRGRHSEAVSFLFVSFGFRPAPGTHAEARMRKELPESPGTSDVIEVTMRHEDVLDFREIDSAFL